MTYNKLFRSLLPVQSRRTCDCEKNIFPVSFFQNDKLGDVLFVVVCIANQTGVDLTEAIEKNLNKKSTRDSKRHWNNPKLTHPKIREANNGS